MERGKGESVEINVATFLSTLPSLAFSNLLPLPFLLLLSSILARESGKNCGERRQESGETGRKRMWGKEKGGEGRDERGEKRDGTGWGERGVEKLDEKKLEKG